MSTSPPLQCSCGITDFVDIRFRSDGVMTFTCFQCRTPMQINLRAVLAEQAWSEMAEPVAATKHIVLNDGTETISHDEIKPVAPERPERYGYKFGGLL